MEFEINGKIWTIKIRPMEELVDLWTSIWKEQNRVVFGLTIKYKQEIWLAEELCREQMIRNLIHELTHCWIWSYGHYFYDDINEECVCEIVAASHKFIDEVVAKFQKELDNGLSNIRTKD